MTKHMVRLYAEPPKGEVDTAINNWVSNFNEWTGAPEEHSLTEGNTELDGSGTQHIRGSWYFHDDSDSKTALLDDVESKLQAVVSWYRIGYHVCDHDASNPSRCSWDDTREYGTVPSDIPTFN